MQYLVARGHFVFALGMIAFGLLSFFFSEPVQGLMPLPEGVTAHAFWAFLSGGVLLMAGIAVFIGWQTRLAAIVIAAMLLLWLLLLHVPKLVANVHDGGEWTCAFETLALCGAAWIFAASLAASPREPARLDPAVERMGGLGRYLFGMSLPAFGTLHFIYNDYVASVIPGWIPAHQFWAWFTGVAHFAAGVAILANVKGRLAAGLAGVMYGCWVLILHVPRVLAAPYNRAEWTSLAVALALTGAAWLVAASFPQSSTSGARHLAAPA